MTSNEKLVDSDQKKRTLDALERRFAVAKAELLSQQHNKKRSLEEGKEGGDGSSRRFSSITTPVRETVASVAPSSTTPFKKGHFAFSGHTPSRGTPGVTDSEENGPTYSRLCQPVHDQLLSAGLELSDRRGNIVDDIVHKLLQSGDSAQKYVQGSRRLKIDNWLLLDTYVQERSASVSSRFKALQSHSKRSKRHMSLKQHRKCGSFDLPPEFRNFNIFKPMYEMWKDYIMKLLKDTGKSQLGPCLLTADLHGAILLVVESKITSFVGVTGIMIRETAETFGIITQDDKFRVVPKKVSVFILQADCWKITLHGDKLALRNCSL